MPQLPFDPTQLSTAFPDVILAVGIALVLAIVTFKPPAAPTIQEALAKMAEGDESNS
jgi:hypothetical protein